jgi:hypothetical protein
MNASQFHSLVHGTKIQIAARSDAQDTASGYIVKCSEYNSRGSLITWNKIKITDAEPYSVWHKYIKRPPQEFAVQNVTLTT